MEECQTCAAVHPDSHPSIEEGMPEDYICPDPFHKRPLKQPLPGTDITRWADRAQYPSETATSTAPVVTLLNATPDPLGSIAALTAMYKGRVVRSLRDLSGDDRRTAFADMMKTELNGALEAVRFQFLVENVTRSWTHQAVRTRQAFFAQESLRFAVVEDWQGRIPDPASYPQWTEGAQRVWGATLKEIESGYEFLVNAGVPSEDARQLLPHGITTRLMVSLDLRTLLHQAGMRLCTQAQFEWRLVMAGMVNAVRGYRLQKDMKPVTPFCCECGVQYLMKEFADDHAKTCDAWQFKLIADMLKPVCYQEGRCTFMASMDRGCTIRERVNANAEIGRKPEQWDKAWEAKDKPIVHVTKGQVAYTTDGSVSGTAAIDPREWAADPNAARANGGGFIGEGAR
jgi:flavin-dependent thymidylate synthase